MVHKICTKLQNYAAHLQSDSAGGIMRGFDKLGNVFVYVKLSSSSSSFGTTTLCGFSPSHPGLSKFFCP